jgi:hypothetical protein
MATDQHHAPAQPGRLFMFVMKVGLPLLIVAAGVLLIVMGHGHYTSVFANRDSLLSATGVGLIIIAGCLVLLNWLMQMSAESFDDRAKEEEAREYFVRTGHWPDDED